ncbi:polymer-forming cytoskeletal protein [Microbacterium sp. R1]|uniref:polymer-forming cytoskeletal protein n=1 Tax=Microbacterium sp. R1 TaxID=322686 RepID=UPI0011C845FB|nr:MULTISPECIES: polymer-forming cytoskeletal protein [Terrabacteria group]MBE7952901.1 polymer-forming cytoskeletal protein [Microbacterium sp. R1]TXF80969.1 polymer-forming cytoskeletal protein [Alkalicoccus halolimnae]
MLRDLSDAWGWLQRIIRRIDRLESGAPLENASITNGRLRIIGGTLRVDSGGSVVIVGTLSIDGTTTVTGNFKVTGPWTLEGNGTITGNVTIAGNVSATGEWTQIGEWHLNGHGSITGDVDITGILTLMSELRVSNAGKITVGSMTLDPTTRGGSVKFAGGPEVYASGTALSLYSGALNGASVELSPGLAKVSAGGARWIEVNASGFRLVGLPTISRSSANNATVGTVYADASGNLYRVVT